MAVLDIDTSMGDLSQIGHASALHSGQAVPAGERWHGSPAQRTDVDYQRVPPARGSALRRFRFATATLLLLFLLYLPLALRGIHLLVGAAPSLAGTLDPAATGAGAVTWRGILAEDLLVSFLSFFGVLLTGLVLVLTVPPLLSPLVKQDRVYPLYGFHDLVHRLITRMTSVKP